MSTQKPQDLLDRTKTFATGILHLSTTLPRSAEVGTLKRQLLRAATSVGANYRAARRSRTRREFVARLSIVEEEADECIYWLDVLNTLQVIPHPRLRALRQEASELVAIVVASKRTARQKGL